jgi:predicted transposase YdaD
VFSQPRHARSFLQPLLPPALARRIAWTTLRAEPGTYVNARLRKTASDVLLSARLRGSPRRVLLYLLFDHQSTIDPLMPLRLLRYAVEAWTHYVARQDAIAGHLPPLVPILLYQGSAPWTAARQLSELYRIPGAPDTDDIPTFIELHMILHELCSDAQPPEELTMLVRAALGLMRLVAAGKISSTDAGRIAYWIEAVRRTDGQEAALSLLSYFFHTNPDERIIDAVAQELSTTMRNHVMSVAEKLEARGLERGKREGRAELVQHQLKLRFRRVPPHVQRRVQAGTLAELERWSTRLLTARTLDEVFAASD